MNPFNRLLEQIDAFIRKYYKNEMIKGALFFCGIFLFSFLVTTTLEFIGQFGTSVRTVLFFGFLVINGFVLVKYIVLPLSRLFSLGKKIDRYQASEIIGSFFPDVSDRLLNTLQLNDSLSQNEGNFELIRASVSQRSSMLSVLPFSSAIDIKESNRKYFKYLVPLVFIFICIAFFLPRLLTQGTERVVHYSQQYLPVAPFEFTLVDTKLEVEEGEDLVVRLLLKGSQFPDKVFLVSEQGKFLMDKDGKNSAKGILKKLYSSISFYFVGNEFESKRFKVHVLRKATLGRFEAHLSYPSYLGREDEIISNAGDLVVPEGTFIEWSVLTKNSSKFIFEVNKHREEFSEEGFKIRKRFLNSSQVRLQLTNNESGKKETSSFDIAVIKDSHPIIQVNEVKDSLGQGRSFFSGVIGDDYGLTSLNFVYSIKSEDGKIRESKLMVNKVSGTEMPFDFAVDFRREKLKLNDIVTYYFIVTDNDAVNGRKSSRSSIFNFEVPSLQELNEKRNDEQLDERESLSDILQKAKDFQKNVDHLKKDVLNSKSKDFNKLNQVQQLQEEQKSLQKSLELLQEKMDQSIQEKNQLSEVDKELLEKQELIDDLLEQVMDDELKSLLDKLEEMMKKDQNSKLDEQMDQLEMSSEDMKKQLDRSLEMLKKLQVNEKIDDIEKELKELSDEQLDLKKLEDSEKISQEKASEQQEELNDKFEQLKEKMSEMDKLNKELSKPMELGNQDQQKEDISKEMGDAKDQLEKGKTKKAGENQKSAADEMQKMAAALDQMQQESNKQEEEEDINSLRAILENLVSLSFSQEEVMNRFGKVKDNDPAYRKYGRVQRSIIDDTKVVKDSLEALAKRQPKIASFIDKELNDIKKNFDFVIEDVDEHRKSSLASHQQSVMTSYNNLALLLNEALESMQKQMKSQQPGSGSCDNPGGKGKPKPGSGMSSGDMKQMLKKQLEQMEKGPNPGGSKPGDKPGQGSSSLPGGMDNKQIAKMAAEQGAMRQRLEQMKKELNKDGKGSGNALNPLLDELEKQQKDLINKNFTSDLVKRQKNILTRLLESEKALMERGFEDQRESKDGKVMINGNQIRFDEYTKQKLEQIELLRSVDPLYRKYYKDKANEYFNRAN